MRVLTNDPSMTAWGWAVVSLSEDQTIVLKTGCIKTESEYKKRRIRKSDDRVRRLGLLTHELDTIIRDFGVEWLLTETPHGSQSASAALMIGAVLGVIATLATCHRLPIEWYSENDAKKHLAGTGTLSKANTIKLISEEYGRDWITHTKYIDEAVADALAVFHVGRMTSPALTFAANQPMTRRK